ncbi:hypothetical protein C8Q75DRAFT_753318 [Abortiporus biennis]|nr:hypothetical protein C8Q75DRAFT_753318 [Abortiporus biennis]
MLDDVLQDTIALFGEQPDDDGRILYGELELTTAPKEGKANTLLADHLFSPSLLLAEQIERGLISLSNTSVVELGAGCALPSLLSTTLAQPPALVVITDYPDNTILNNLKDNISRNSRLKSPLCAVHCVGYEWGKDIGDILELLPRNSEPRGYDVVILSDLLHFDASHGVLISSLTSLLRKTNSARTYVAAGKYTPKEVCKNFLKEAELTGISWEEGEDDPTWRGKLEVKGGGLDIEQLGVRKGMCRWWIGRWDVNHPSNRFTDFRRDVDA